MKTVETGENFKRFSTKIALLLIDRLCRSDIRLIGTFSNAFGNGIYYL